MSPVLSPSENQQVIQDILATIESVVLGKPQECKLALACLLAQGHLLIEDLPGMGKTTLAHMLATTLGLSYQRIQFTSDLLPADVVGFSMLNHTDNSFELHKGAIFNQVVLADEINRASPKTQSALLEAMAEEQVSIDGATYELPSPFFVIATQNPLSHSGTYPLPESQLDRFMMRLSLGFPDLAAEKKILLSHNGKNKTLTKAPTVNHTAIIDQAGLLAMQQAVQEVTVANDVLEYIIALSHISRSAYVDKPLTAQQSNKTGSLGDLHCNPLSPRASKALLSAAKAVAFIDNRDYVLPDDVQAVFYVVCQHRLEQTPTQILSQHAQKNSIAQRILEQVDVLNPLAY
ncbi:MoxR family ATPase [Colwellia sp. D2M02]|uniref:AAA family ATPase n=1 Tax=Colwellia asteriadis TaxID=517723 RepID=A0ABP3WKG5_9GAMM|nr:MoxR family ATPase [Colwellia sp. D2M02]MBU2892540.1 MoxR family ATPase [Colwellia sp. D2M02]